MNRIIQIQLQRSQMETLADALSGINIYDHLVFGNHTATMMDYFITRIKERVTSRLLLRETNKRKFKISFHQAEVAALMQTFARVHFNSDTEAALMRTILMELDRHIQ